MNSQLMSIAGLLVILTAWFVGVAQGTWVSDRVYRRELVKRGYGCWSVGDYGDTTFKWKDPQ